jgi:hypothetical protein
VTGDSTVQPLRIAFDIVNVPLQRPLAIDAFLLTPVDGVADVLGRLRNFAAESEITATGVFALPPVTSMDRAYEPFWRPARVLTLLLSFANRCHIQVVRPTLEAQIDGQWVRQGWHANLFREGKAGAVGWYVGQPELEGFLERAYPKLIDPVFAEATGLRLALEFVDQARCEVVGEMQYLKTWIALEILYGHAQEGRAQIISANRFEKIRRALRQSLADLGTAGRLQDDELAAMREKLPELNRPSAQRQLLAFCERVFMEYPAQDLNEAEAQRFIRIRNEITHGGVMPSTGGDGYARALSHEHGRLRALVERVVLAMLGEQPNLMEFSWRNYLAAV